MKAWIQAAALKQWTYGAYAPYALASGCVATEAWTVSL